MVSVKPHVEAEWLEVDWEDTCLEMDGDKILWGGQGCFLRYLNFILNGLVEVIFK